MAIKPIMFSFNVHIRIIAHICVLSSVDITHLISSNLIWA